MSVVISYKGSTIASANTDITKTLKTSGKYCEGDILIQNTQDGGITPSGTTNITENGIYDVTNFASANVNVSGGGGGNEDGFIDRTLTSITNNSVSKIGDYAFANCIKLTTASIPQCFSVGSNAFRNCSSLTTVSFPQCSIINSAAFANCNKLTTASFPQCFSVGGNAFSNCSSLTTASFPQCSIIGSAAFLNCRKLTTASFTECKIIGSSAFYNCYNLLSLYLLGSSIPTLSNIDAFTSTPISNYTTSTGGVYGSIIVPVSMIDQYKVANNWNAYSSRFSAWNGID